MTPRAVRKPRLIWVAALLWVLAAAAAPGSVAGVTSLLLDSEPGEPVGQSEFHFYTTDDGRFSEDFDPSTAEHVRLRFSGPGIRPTWNLQFAAPVGEPLAVQAYENAVYFYRRQPGEPGMFIQGNVSGCYDSFGRFEVKQIVFDGAGVLTNFWATFEQTCADAVLRGEIRFNADTPIVLEAPSQVAIGAGRTLAFVVRGHDAQGDPVALSATGLPPGATFADEGDGTGHLSMTTEIGQMGGYLVAFQGLSDGGAVDVVYTHINVIADFDDFDQALPIPSLPFETTVEHTPATSAPDDPVCPPPAGGPRPDPEGTVWYSFTPVQDTRVHAVTYAPCSPGSPVLSVYTGARGALEEITCNTREARFNAVAGVTYYLMIGLEPGSTFGLSVEVAPPPPPNDELAQATVVGALPFHDTLDVSGAGITHPDDNAPCGGFAPCLLPLSRGTVWYTYTPAEDTLVTVDAAGSGVGVLLAAFGEGHAFINCGSPTLSFTARAGQTYQLMAATSFPFGSAAAQLVLSITGSRPLEIGIEFDTEGTFDPQTGAAIINATATCSRPVGIVVRGTLQQRQASGQFEVAGQCDGTARLRIEVTPGPTARPKRGRFLGGRARVDYQATTGLEEPPVVPALVTGMAGVVLKGPPRR